MAELKQVRIGDRVLARVCFDEQKFYNRASGFDRSSGYDATEEGYVQRIKYDKPGYDVKFPRWERILFIPMQDIIEHYGQEHIGHSELRAGEWVDAIVRYGEFSDHRTGGFVLRVHEDKDTCDVNFLKHGGPCFVRIVDITKRYSRASDVVAAYHQALMSGTITLTEAAEKCSKATLDFVNEYNLAEIEDEPEMRWP